MNLKDILKKIKEAEVTFLKIIELEPNDFDHFGLGRVGEYFSNFSDQNVWGKCGKSKNALGFFISNQNAWDV